MSGMRTDILRAGLDTLHFSRAHKLMAPYAGGIGLIFMLHQVCPAPRRKFAPNKLLTLDPKFLDLVIEQVRNAGLEIISLDDMHERMMAGDCEHRFAVFTLDDGYRDNLTNAYPVFQRHDVPFTIYVPGDYPGGEGELWWLALEEIIARNTGLEVDLGGGAERIVTKSTDDKWSAYETIYWRLRAMPEERQREVIRGLAKRYGFDLAGHCREMILSWDEIRTMARDPLVTIGAHTAGHYALAKLEAKQARSEVVGGMDRLEAELGARPRHFSFPYGDEGSAGPRDFEIARSAGFDTAVTTRKGMIFPEHKDHMTALPRVSLNGEYQALKYIELYLSGAPFALWNGFGRLNVA